MPTKAFAGSVNPEGVVTARVATIGGDRPDSDGDIIAPGCVPDNTPVILSAWSHDSVTSKELPVGVGILHARGDSLLFDGQYFMDTQRGRDAFTVVRQLGTLAQWSWAFLVRRTAEPSNAQRALGARRVLLAVEAIEATATARGAGLGTGTISTREETDIQRQARALFEDFQRISRRIDSDRAAVDPAQRKLREIARRVGAIT